VWMERKRWLEKLSIMEISSHVCVCLELVMCRAEIEYTCRMMKQSQVEKGKQNCVGNVLSNKVKAG